MLGNALVSHSLQLPEREEPHRASADALVRYLGTGDMQSVLELQSAQPTAISGHPHPQADHQRGSQLAPKLLLFSLLHR